MRRNECAILEPEKIREVIESCKYIRIGLYDAGEIYVLPLNFGYAEENGQLVFYMHGAKEGRKTDLASSRPQVGFEMDSEAEIVSGSVACSFSARYQSVIGNGELSIVEDREEKLRGLCAIMRQATGRSDWDFPEKIADAVCVLKLRVTKLSCKVRR